MRPRISTESIVLASICLADMLITLYLVLNGLATEQNPIMAACIRHSPATFVLVKLVSFVPFVIAVELYRRRNPEFARKVCLYAIGIYVLALVVLTAGTNLT